MIAQAVLDGPLEKPATANGCLSPSSAPISRCAECGELFRARQYNQLFCRPAHRRAYNNRWLARGLVLAPLYCAARATRGGSRGDKATGAKARADAERLAQRWKEEDQAAGRISHVAYIAARYKVGLVEVFR